jgi:hypothetical protein
LTDRVRHAQMTDALRHVKARLGSPGASARAAEAILELAFARTAADKNHGGAKSA